uniref:Uncharacterized protein n=1 Tax=Sphenodon punctatus TaxID=8508 RepID=A0A8D0GZM6_SPHPU
MVKGAALFLQQGNSPQGQRSVQQPHKHALTQTRCFFGDLGSLPLSHWCQWGKRQ